MLLRSTALLQRRTCIFKCLGTIRYRAEVIHIIINNNLRFLQYLDEKVGHNSDLIKVNAMGLELL